MLLRRSFPVALLLSLLLIWIPGPEVGAADDFAGLAAAIQAANGGSRAITLSGDIILTASLPPITGSLTIDGGGHTISGNDAFRIFDVRGGRLAIHNLRMASGQAPDEEGGGAIRARAGANLMVERVVFSDNAATRGGAIFSDGSRIEIASSSFQANQAQQEGGALAAHEETRMFVKNSTFSENLASVGGALEVFASQATLTHVTIMPTGPSWQMGRAIHRTAGEIRLYNSIIGGEPGGRACSNGLTETRGNLSQDGTCSLMETTIDPLVGELTGTPGWFPLLDGSPALDAAEPEYCLETDQVGTARPRGGGCDIGAIESTTARLAPTPVVPPPPCPLSHQIIAANTDAPSGGCPAGKGADTITLVQDVALQESLPTITSDITIEGDGYAISGGGHRRIFDIERGNLTLRNMTLKHARATYGAAIRLRGSARVAIDQVTFSKNRADGGGAIASLSSGASATISRSDFVGNKSDEYGGAINVTRGSVTISNSSFTGNQAGWFGGALHIEYGSVNASNSTFVDNSAVGGGVLNGHIGKATFTHVTMQGNLATQTNGNAINNSGSAIYLRNSIVGGDGEANDCSGGLTQASGNLSEDGTCIVAGVYGDPMLGDSTGSPAWRAPFDGSPAIDAADPAFCSGTDQIGTPRPQGGGCDIGAIESTTARPAERVATEPVCSLRDQIIAANTDRRSGACPAGNGADTISLSDDITLTRPLPQITSGLRIEGNGHTISGDGRFRIFVVNGAWLQINNLTLTAGSNPRGNGGAIKMLDDSSVAIRNSRFIANSASSGGAITMFGRNGKLTVIDSSFVENSATYEYGGNGGAIDKLTGQLFVTGSSFVRNQAGYGGAIFSASGGETRIANSTFSENKATSKGGALAAGYPPVILTHVTMLNNWAVDKYLYGAGHALWIRSNNTGFYLRNSIIAGDKPDENCLGKLTQSVGNLVLDSSCASSTSSDALLGPLSGEPAWHSLQAGSPAIDAADSRYCLATDQTGRSRPQGGGCDIGAIETIPVQQVLSDCQVTTTHALNFRDGPAGRKFGTVPEQATAAATARTPNWFQIGYAGRTGWISADYAVAVGQCG